jgi:mannose-6-phosphate isomerase-like protein (cupin superfamily)
MSIIFPDQKHSIHVHGPQAEIVGSKSAKIKLLVDSNATGGALSTVQVTLEKDSDGARPHRYDHSAEMFYVLNGSLQVLSGTEIVKAERGDVIVVPLRLPHAFAAARGHGAELLIFIAPGIEPFEYFRKLTRIARGEEPPEVLGTCRSCMTPIFQKARNGQPRATRHFAAGIGPLPLQFT